MGDVTLNEYDDEYNIGKIEESQESKDQRLEFERKESFVRSFAEPGDIITLLGINMSVVAIKESRVGLWQFGIPSYTDGGLPYIRCMYCLNTNEIKFIKLRYDELQYAELLP